MTRQEAVDYILSLPENTTVEVSVVDKYITSGEVEAMGISRPRLKYWVKCGYVKTIPHGSQKRYLLNDVLKIIS